LDRLLFDRLASAFAENQQVLNASLFLGKQSVQGSVSVKRTKEHEIELEGNDGITVSSLNSVITIESKPTRMLK
jgi:hypothetical protein